MEKIATIIILISNFVAFDTLAHAETNLKNRLNGISSFYAKFIQKAIDENKNVLQEGTGELWVKRPNLFYWHMMQPDENILVSDGKTLWFYNPLIQQATATWLQDIINNTPFVLFSYNLNNDWKQYKINQIEDDFELIPKNKNNNLKLLRVNVSRNGTIRQLETLDHNNQKNTYQLHSQKKSPINVSIFTFIPPKNVTVDDQRKRISAD